MRTRLRAHRKRATRGAFELVETGACGCTRAQVFILMHSLPRVALLLGYRRMRALYPQFYVRSSDKTALSLFVSLPPSLPSPRMPRDRCADVGRAHSSRDRSRDIEMLPFPEFPIVVVALDSFGETVFRYDGTMFSYVTRSSIGERK